MSTLLATRLVGRKVRQAGENEAGLWLQFDDGAGLNILNSLKLVGFAATESLSQLIGSEVIAVEDNPPQTLEIVFVGGRSICVGLADDDYFGPEALVYSGADGIIMV